MKTSGSETGEGKRTADSDSTVGKLGVITIDGMIWLSENTATSDAVTSPCDVSSPTIPETVPRGSPGLFLESSCPTTVTAETDTLMERERELADSQMIAEVLNLAGENCAAVISEEGNFLRAITWATLENSSDFSAISSEQLTSDSAHNWVESVTGMDQLNEWGIANESENLTENLTESFQNSLDFFFTSPFFNSFPNSADGMPEVPYETITPEQQAIYLQEMFPTNFPITEVTVSSEPAECLNAPPLFDTPTSPGTPDSQTEKNNVELSSLTQKTESSRTEPNRTERNRTESDQAESNRTEPDRVGPERTELNRTELNQTEPDRAEPLGKRTGFTAWQRRMKKLEKLEKLEKTENAEKTNQKLKKRSCGTKLSRRAFSVKVKMHLVEKYGRETTKDQVTLSAFCQRHGLNAKQLKTWVMTYDALSRVSSKQLSLTRIRPRAARFPKLEEALLHWVKTQQSVRNVLEQKDVQNVAKSLSKEMSLTGFSASLGWVKRFTERHGLQFGGRRNGGGNRRCTSTAQILL